MELLALIPDASGNPEAASRAIRLAMATFGLIGIAFLGLLLLMTLRRAARHRARHGAGRSPDTSAPDAWHESARRLRTPLFDGDADPDDDTIDFDPEKDNPGRP